MVLQLYVDHLSQPARALMLFIRKNKIEHEEKIISIFTGEQKTEEYAKVNRFKKVPAIVHDGFQLAESVAILRYLVRTFPVEDHWYPKDSKSQARVDEFLEWQHLGLRSPLTRYILASLMPKLLGLDGPPTEVEMAHFRENALKALDEVENIWLEGSKFIHGDTISIADLIAVGELEMTKLIGFVLNIRESRPKLTAYLERVRDSVGGDLYDEVHAGLDKAVEHFKSLQAK